ncbi:MAG: (2,3-dihydroxybenzoyl)adenylate synthase [Marinobacterium sp.]|nr:(2,3-dihydroxybenzoyl)adenylate synthase [Marinobacterium sp.]
MIPFSRWPDQLACQYREAGYWDDQPLTALLQRSAEQTPDAIALICGDRQFSYQQLDQQSTALACVLQQRGIQPGSTALVQLPNVAEFYLVFFALLKRGVAAVNALFNHQRLELSEYCRQLQPSLLIASREHGLFSDQQGNASNDFIAHLQSISPTLNTVLMLGDERADSSLSAQLVPQPGQHSDPLQPSPADQVAFFQLSGGSTGTPKLIPRTHNDYAYSVRRSAEICQLSSASRYLCALPAAHNFPLSSPGALGIFYAGGCVVLARSPEAGHCFKLIEQHKVTLTGLVPSAVNLWLQAAPGQQHRLASLKLLQVGGASFAESMARRVPAELGCALQQVFGMAEGLVNYTRLDDNEARIFTCQGRPMSPADEVRVVDHNGQPVAEGETGLLMTRGPYTFRGYFNAPAHNASAFDAEGFYCSGDLVQQDADGYLRVVGRDKDQINRGGEKIAAEEIENLLLGHPAVSQAALISIPDPLLGEKTCACLVSSDPTLRPVQLRRYLRELGIAEFKLPDRFQQLDSLPLTAVGKTDKRQLQQQFSPAAAVSSQ